jgi:Initiator Replication protein
MMTLIENTELIKASAAIQVDDDLTELQRLAVNIMLYNAYNELPDLTIEKHCIRLSELTDAIGYSSRNLAYLKQLLKGIQSKTLEFNLLGKDKTQKWGSYALLAEVEIERGVCYYAFGPTLRRLFYNPKVYARINLSIQSQLRHKHATTLFEICVDYLDESKKYGETPWITLPTFKRLLGVAGDVEFKVLNRDVIKPAVERVEEKTDFKITIEREKKGRKVSALKFRIRQVLKLPKPDIVQRILFPNNELPEIIKKLVEVGLRESDGAEIWQQQFDYVDAAQRKKISPDREFVDYIHEKIDLLKRKQALGGVKNATGFLIRAIKENWANPEYVKSQQNGTKGNNEARESYQAALETKGKLEAKRHRLEDEHEQQLTALCRQIANDEPELLERICDEVVKGTKFNWSLYDKSKSPLENYLGTQGLRSLIDERLMREFPKQFEELRNIQHNTMLALDKKIEALG